MPPITASTDVDRPAEDVFAYATDPTRFSEWQKGVVDGHLDETGNPQVGARCVTTRRIGFANRPTTAELTHVDPPKRGACAASTDPSAPSSTSPSNPSPPTGRG